MSSDDEYLVRRVYEVWNGGDVDAASVLLHPEFELRTAGVYPDLQPVYRGVGGAMEYWDTLRDAWADFAIYLERLETVGDRVVLCVTQRGEGRQGIETERRWGAVATIEDGLMRRLEAFGSWEEALEAAG